MEIGILETTFYCDTAIAAMRSILENSSKAGDTEIDLDLLTEKSFDIADHMVLELRKRVPRLNPENYKTPLNE